MHSQIDFTPAFAIKPRSRMVYSHRISSSFVRAKQGFVTIRSASYFPRKLAIAAFTETNFLYRDERKPINPYARTFVILWLLGSLAAIGASYIHL